ncbi:MAG: hypothetical protein QM776_03780 [Rhodocyclaceae bacterium]
MLIAVHGEFCADWEDVIDNLLAERDLSGVAPFCVTTSHPGDSLNDVLDFAQRWTDGSETHAEVLLAEL